MSVRQSLLAILDQGPCYGYQLRSEFHRRTGSTWPLNVGQIYNTLDRLERDGLVEKTTVSTNITAQPAETSTGQIYYRITEAGSAEVATWLNSPVTRTAATRDELAIKLAVAVTLPGVDVVRVLNAQRAATKANIVELTKLLSEAGEPTSSEKLASLLVVDSMIVQAEAELLWLDRTESRLNLATASGSSAPMSLSTEVPKRGRPAGVSGH